MTVCIAARLYGGPDSDAKIILCRDWRGEVEGIGSADTFVKIKRLSSGWVALIANNLQRADELIVRFEDHLKTTPLTESNLPNEVRKVYSAYKRDLADSFLQSKFGFSLETLITKGIAAFGEKFTTDCFYEISKISADVDLLICGFVDAFDYERKRMRPMPMICSVSEANEGDPVVLEDDFGTIGSGSTVARSFMLSRELMCQDHLMEAVYTVYEAKHMSENVPGVGESFSIDLMHPDGSLDSLSSLGFERCKKLFARFGPRSIDHKKHADSWLLAKTEYFQPFMKEDEDEEE